MLKRISVSILGTQLVNCYPFSPVSFWSYWHCFCSVDGRFGSRAGSSQYDFVHAFLEVTGQFMETVLQQGTEASFQKESEQSHMGLIKNLLSCFCSHQGWFRWSWADSRHSWADSRHAYWFWMVDGMALGAMCCPGVDAMQKHSKCVARCYWFCREKWLVYGNTNT